jgi:hypothetical protein
MITDYLKTGYPVLLVRTHEPERFTIDAALKVVNGRNPYQRDGQGLPGMGQRGGVAGERP